jgi:hypothetical protein
MTHKDMFKDISYESLEKQVGGKHYKSLKNSTCTLYK